jgi:hypothetical protein
VKKPNPFAAMKGKGKKAPAKFGEMPDSEEGEGAKPAKSMPFQKMDKKKAVKTKGPLKKKEEDMRKKGDRKARNK